jgi:hypothetical protein
MTLRMERPEPAATSSATRPDHASAVARGPRRRQHIAASLALGLLGAFASSALARQETPPPAGNTTESESALEAAVVLSSYLGLSVRDIAGLGCVVAWIDPGPLNGRGLESDSLGRPDLIVAIDGRSASEATLAEIVGTKFIGDPVTISYRRAIKRDGAFPEASSLPHDQLWEPAVQKVTATLADRRLWTGTFGDAQRPSFMSGHALAGEGPFAGALLLAPEIVDAINADRSLRERLDRLLIAQQALSATQPDARRLSHVTAALTQPFALPELAESLTAPAFAGLRPARLAATLTATALDAPPPSGEAHGSVPIPGVQSAIYALDFFANQTRLHMQEALGDAYGNERVARRALATMMDMRSSLLIGGPDASERFGLIRRGADIEMHAIVAALAHLDADIALAAEVIDGEVEGIPDELKDAVEGVVLSAQRIPEIGWAVVGGRGPNRYDLSKVAAVIDLDGDDHYWMSGLALGMRVVIDLTGDDRYEGHADQGIAGGLCGLFLVDDHAGNDHYIGHALHAGAGCFGAGLLIDRAGNDRYEGTTWALGAACWGSGMLIDLAGNDAYVSEFLSQGCGGPRGLGAIVDQAGNDSYDAVGNRPSLYGTPETTASFSQGVGVGIRRAAAGGIGMLCDGAGNDGYRAGEFAQGGGYFFAYGILRDGGGNDTYEAARYAQGWAAHQASGALVDASGNDAYRGRVAASQGAAWDQSTALLHDLEGDDTYDAGGLAQGAAAQQSLAFLLDGGGSDRYDALGGTEAESVQGQSGRNEYHFGRPAPIGGVYSFSLLLDRPGVGGAAEIDLFSTGRPVGTTMRTGREAERPSASTFDGLFVDLPPAPSSNDTPDAQPRSQSSAPADR